MLRKIYIKMRISTQGLKQTSIHAEIKNMKNVTTNLVFLPVFKFHLNLFSYEL